MILFRKVSFPTPSGCYPRSGPVLTGIVSQAKCQGATDAKLSQAYVLTGARSSAEACLKYALSPNLQFLCKATFQRDDDQDLTGELEQLRVRASC